MEERDLVCFVLEIFNVKCPCDSQWNMSRQLESWGWAQKKTTETEGEYLEVNQCRQDRRNFQSVGLLIEGE